MMLITNNKRTLIIAEAGVNHNGDLKQAFELVDMAVNAGADVIKFQTFVPEELLTRSAPKAAYQKINTNSSESQIEMLEKLALTFDEFLELKEYSNSRNIEFLTTSFGEISTQFLFELDLQRIKIPSGEITNYPYLKKLAGAKKETIISTGMSDVVEIQEAIDVLLSEGLKRSDLTILHCVSEYPTSLKNINLSKMIAIKDLFHTSVGFSDHTDGIKASIVAVSMGATVIEKHITLDKNMPGPDHKASMEFNSFLEMVNGIREVEEILGNSKLEPTEEEIKNKKVARKSLVAKSKIAKGEVFNESNITSKRPGTGISPMRWNEVIGQRATNNYEVDDLLAEEL